MSISDRAEVIHEVHGKQGTVRRAGIRGGNGRRYWADILSINYQVSREVQNNQYNTYLDRKPLRNRSNPVRQNRS